MLKSTTMLKFMGAAAALFVSCSIAAPVLAAPPADLEACNKLSFSLAEKAVAKKLTEADAAKVDELMSKLEGQCADGKFTEAEATANEIDGALAR